MPSYCYVKRYSANDFGSMVLDNPEPLDAVNHQMYDELLRSHNSPEQRRVKLKLLRMFREIYEYDIDHAFYPEQFGHFDTEEDKAEHRRISLLNQDCIHYLGAIFAGYHQALMEAKQHLLIEFSSHIIDFAEVYQKAYAEYTAVLLKIPQSPRIVTKNSEKQAQPIVEQAIAYTGVTFDIPSRERGGKVNRPPHAITATYVYPALLEQALSMYIENSIIYRWIDKLDSSKLNENERALHSALKNMRDKGYGLITGDRRKLLQRIWDIGEKCGVFQDAFGMKQIMYGKNGGDDLTLGDIIGLKYTESQIRPEYLDVLKLLFGRKNLNLRNRIAHGDRASFDYLHVGYVAIMHQILLDIASDDVFYMKGCYAE